MPVNLKKDDMGDVVKDFYKSDAPQFKGKSKKKRREMAIAAKLSAEESFDHKIDTPAHNKAKKKSKMRNLAIKNPNENEGNVAHKKAGGPKLYGEGKSFGEYRKAVSSVFKKKETPPHKYPEGTKYKDPADAAKKKLKVRAQKAAGIFPDAADENPERSSSK